MQPTNRNQDTGHALRWARGLVLAGLATLFAFASAPARAGQPLDLSNADTRWVEVRFEISPEEAPGQLDGQWGPPRRAELGRGPDGQTIQIRVPAAEIEAQLRSTGADPVAGSFSDFVWRLDPQTGHVLDAALEGRVRSRIDFGLLTTRTEIAIRVEMNTRFPAGYQPRRAVLGNPMHGFCTGLDRARGCTLVNPRPYDPTRGYVNAVGFLSAENPLAKIRTFSPLGEVVFRERADKEKTSILSGPLPHDAVCSGALSGACEPDLRGESS